MSWEVVSAILSACSLGLAGLATMQSIRLAEVKRMRNIDMKSIWNKQKRLSEKLFHKDESEFSREACGQLSQEIEQDIASFMLKIKKWSASEIQQMVYSKYISEFDQTVLLRLLDKK